MFASLEDVTASFATSLALASGDVVDISHLHQDAPPHTDPRRFLLARPTTSRRVSPVDLEQHFKRIWQLARRFRVQARGPNLFIITFNLPRDRSKVFWGGPWYYMKMPVVLEEYDGLRSPASIPMNKLYFWVNILNIPKALEKDPYIKNVATVAGLYICKDERLFLASELIRVRVFHALDRPFYENMTMKIIEGVVETISFQFENLIGLCKHCNLIQHEDAKLCFKAGGSNGNPSSSKGVLPASFPATRIGFSNEAFQFQGSASASTSSPAAASSPFDPKPVLRKPTIVRKDVVAPEPEQVTLVADGQDDDPVLATLKRPRPHSPTASPKKAKVGGASGASLLATLQKKQKTPIPRITARALGLEDDGSGTDGKKKRGRPFGSKKAVSADNVQVVAADGGMSMQAVAEPPSPNSKGKDVL